MKRIRIVRWVNWKYAVGEFLLIFAGILAALATAEWNDRRLARAEERTVLREMRSSLDSDLAELRGTLATLRASEGRVVKLLETLKADAPYSEEIDGLFGGVYGVVTSAVNGAPYEALKSRGLSLVRDDTLRIQIMEVYDRAYEHLDISRDGHLKINSMLNRPYFLQYFSDLVPHESAHPIDWEELTATPYLENLVSYRLLSLRGNSIYAHETTIAAVEKLIGAIDAYVP